MAIHNPYNYVYFIEYQSNYEYVFIRTRASLSNSKSFKRSNITPAMTP